MLDGAALHWRYCQLQARKVQVLGATPRAASRRAAWLFSLWWL